MAKRQSVDATMWSNIVALNKQHHSSRKIAESLQRSKSVVGRIVTLFNYTSLISSPKKMDRRQKSSARDDRVTQRLALRLLAPAWPSIQRLVNGLECRYFSNQACFFKNLPLYIISWYIFQQMRLCYLFIGKVTELHLLKNISSEDIQRKIRETTMPGLGMSALPYLRKDDQAVGKCPFESLKRERKRRFHYRYAIVSL